MNSHQKLPTELLNIPGVVVKNVRQIDCMGMGLQIESECQQATCPRCGQTSARVHQNHYFPVKDLPLSSHPTFLRVNRRQFKCKRCQKPFSESLNYVDKNKNYTKRLAQTIVKQVLDSNIRSVARQHELSEAEIEAMVKHAGKQRFSIRPVNLKRLGLDEISLRKGQGN
jgi:transposase